MRIKITKSKRDLWYIGIYTGTLLIFTSYMLWTFNSPKFKSCGSGGSWPLFVGSILAVCMPTKIPHPLVQPFFNYGVLLVVISIVGWLFIKPKKIERPENTIPKK